MIMRNKSHNRNKTHGISKIINSKQRMRKCYLLTCAARGNIKTYSLVRIQVSNIMDKNFCGFPGLKASYSPEMLQPHLQS